jgi:hypothetical protein
LVFRLRQLSDNGPPDRPAPLKLYSFHNLLLIESNVV